MQKFPEYCYPLLRLALVVCFALGVIVPTAADPEGEVVAWQTPTSSESDDRAYRYLELENQLAVLLISDPASDKAAAALDVHVGHNDDPVERGGLAHFLEHMLFLGTEKYPQPDAYQQFIAEHGGSHNAYTSDEHTNYFFDVSHTHLEPALDRFAQFFIAPLFTPQYVERERRAVHSEYRARIKNDYRRQIDVFREVVRAEHPASKFSVGNLDTLADREGGRVRDELLDFYEKFYSSDNMTLVVLGRESLNELQHMVTARFSAVPLRRTSDPVQGEQLFDEESLPLQLEIEPVQNVRRMTLSFPMPLEADIYRNKPLAYLGSILGHEGEGSLLSLLKRQGWAEGLSAGGRTGSRNQGMFDITISLTEPGLEQRDRVLAATLDMIETLRCKGVREWRYREQAQLAQLDFRFANKRDAVHTVSRLASDMHDYAAEDILRGNYAYDDYDQDMIKRHLREMTFDNLLLVVVAPEVKTDRVSEFYETPYRVSKLREPPEPLAREFAEQLHLPEKNQFIPRRLEVKSHPSTTEVPLEIVSEPHLSVWYAKDRVFELPRAEIRLRMLSPLVGSNVQAAAISHLFAEMINDQLNEYTYPARLAGLSYTLSANSRGFDVRVSGFDDRQQPLFAKILETLADPKLAESRFTSLKRELIRSWRNQQQMTPYRQLFRKLPVALFSPLWDKLEMADALQQVTLQDMEKFAAEIGRGSHTRALIFGNVLPEEARNLATLIDGLLPGDIQEKGEAGLSGAVGDPGVPPLTPARVVDLPEQPPHLHLPVVHQDVAAMLYLQALDDTPLDRAAMMMIRKMLASRFFHELRTEKQLGYIVFITEMELKDVMGAVFVVQSPTTPLADVIREIQQFVAREAGTTDELEVYRQALLAELTEAPRNIGQQAGQYWSEITANSEDFKRRERLIESVRGLAAEQLADYSQQVLGQQTGVWLTAAEADVVEGYSVQLLGSDQFDSPAFKESSESFEYP